MPLPHLPDDILSEILSHFFGSTSVAIPISPPTPVKGSTSLLLTSKRFRTLSLPLFWRSITIHQPFDFVSLFGPKIGLLHAKGEVGKERRGWIQTLSGGDHDLFVELSPANFPNLKHLFLAVGSDVWQGFGKATDPAFDALVRKVKASWEEDWNKTKEAMEPWKRALADEVEEDEGPRIEEVLFSIEMWTHLERRNDEVISSLLASNAKQIRTLRLEMDNTPVVNWKDPRLPSSIEEAKNLVVTLVQPDRSFRARRKPKLPSQVGSFHGTVTIRYPGKEGSKEGLGKGLG
ncbi:hypothetical protein BDY24DRAFT_417123 [Mrakia frigida]|uniref:uncharacterized protein n=1 Tax=Mrakia frigida TaxID=29902 RepID=UPI003FCC1076